MTENRPTLGSLPSSSDQVYGEKNRILPSQTQLFGKLSFSFFGD
ncbi:hypothetical protein BGP_0873 [Beggiatoa sp. PS]|nr:hypothetical protein BGP_0873 [Beggiatoa sp. PS]